MSLLKASCSDCEFEQKLSKDILRTYMLDANEQVFVPTVYGWCNECETVTAIEELPSLQEIEDRISCSTDPDWTERLHVMRRWRIQRRAPAKCLECGKTNFNCFVPLDDDAIDSDDEWEKLPHPGCTGMIELRGIGFSQSGAWIRYTVNGTPITAPNST